MVACTHQAMLSTVQRPLSRASNSELLQFCRDFNSPFLKAFAFLNASVSSQLLELQHSLCRVLVLIASVTLSIFLHQPSIITSGRMAHATTNTCTGKSTTDNKKHMWRLLWSGHPETVWSLQCMASFPPIFHLTQYSNKTLDGSLTCGRKPILTVGSRSSTAFICFPIATCKAYPSLRGSLPTTRLSVMQMRQRTTQGNPLSRSARCLWKAFYTDQWSHLTQEPESFRLFWSQNALPE